MSGLGQKPISAGDHVRSALPPIVLQKSFWGGDQNFSGPLMPFARGDMRDHIVLHKNDHGASYGRYAVLQWWSRLKISFCEIFGVVQFSTFATLSGVKRTCRPGRRMSANGATADTEMQCYTREVVGSRVFCTLALPATRLSLGHCLASLPSASSSDRVSTSSSRLDRTRRAVSTHRAKRSHGRVS